MPQATLRQNITYLLEQMLESIDIVYFRDGAVATPSQQCKIDGIDFIYLSDFVRNWSNAFQKKPDKYEGHFKPIEFLPRVYKFAIGNTMARLIYR